MKVKAFALAAGAASLLAIGTASGEFTIGVTEITDQLVGGSDPITGFNYTSDFRTFQYYLEFDSPTGELVAIFAEPDIGQSAWNLQAAAGATIWTSPIGGNTPVEQGFLGDAFSNQADSFFTIGIGHGVWEGDNPIGVAPGSGISFSGSGGTAITSNVEAAVFNFEQGAAGNGYGIAGNYDNNRVMFLQVTLNVGNVAGDLEAPLTGTLAFQTATGQQYVEVELPTLTAVPAPGALALLGVAGLVGTRRRRA